MHLVVVSREIPPMGGGAGHVAIHLAEKLPADVRVKLVEEDLSLFDLLSRFSMLTAMIGMRLHSTIMAHIAGVPALHIAYKHKGWEHYENMNMKELVVDIDQACYIGERKHSLRPFSSSFLMSKISEM